MVDLFVNNEVTYTYIYKSLFGETELFKNKSSMQHDTSAVSIDNKQITKDTSDAYFITEGSTIVEDPASLVEDDENLLKMINNQRERPLNDQMNI